MSNFMKTNTGILLLIFSALLISACSSTKQLTGIKPSAQIIVDGNPAEWEGKLRYIEDHKCAVGFQNDNEYLHICLQTFDLPTMMNILRMGLTLWFEPEEGKVLGIKYPLRMDRGNSGPGNLGRKPRERFDINGNNYHELNNRLKMLLKDQPNLQIVNQDEFPLYSYPVNNPTGFKISLGMYMRKIIYEIRVPIAENKLAPVIINSYPNERLKVLFETGEFDMAAFQKQNGGMRPESGMRPGGRKGGMRRNPGMADTSGKFELELELILDK